MKTARDKQVARKTLLGLPVVTLGETRMLGEVSDVVCDARQGIITGIVAQAQGGTALVIPLGAVRGINPEAVTVESLDAPSSATEGSWPQEGRVNGPRLIGMPVITDSGKVLGKVEDVVFDAQSGRLSGFELSDGLIQDLVAGRTFLPIPDVYAIGPNAIVVSVSEAGAPNSGPAVTTEGEASTQ